MQSVGTPPADILIDETLVRSLLREQHNDLSTLAIRPLDSGWDNAIFRLGNNLLARLPRRESAAALMVNEQRWLPSLKHLPLPIPAPLRIGRPSANYPWHWSVTPWSPGVPLDQTELESHQANVLAEFLKALHVTAPHDAPRNPVRGVPLISRNSAVRERIASLQRKTTAVTGIILNVWEQALAAPIDVPDTWIHGDLHARNVLVQAGRLSAIIDWGDMAQGDCATDLAAIWMLLPHVDDRQRVIDAYKNISSATLQRARGWAVLFGVTLLDTGLLDDPRHALMGESTLERVIQGP